MPERRAQWRSWSRVAVLTIASLLPGLLAAPAGGDVPEAREAPALAAPAGGDVPEAREAPALAALRTARTGGALGDVLDVVAAGLAPAAPANRGPRRAPTEISMPPLAGPVGRAIGDLAATVAAADAAVRAAVAPTRRAAVQAAVARLAARGPSAALSDPLVAEAVRSVDLPAMATAAADIAAKIDALLAVAVDAGVPGAAAAECDVADALPYVCVAGAGANVHTSNAWLTVDLGGADVYRNHTGVGACLGDVDDAEPEPCVGVSVDLGGDDRYEPTSAFLHACEMGGVGPDHNVCTQGAGLLGVGILVDAGGDDSYEAVVRTKDDDCLGGNFTICGVLDAQGSGRFGVGVLADLGGDDRYTTTAPLPAADAPSDRSITLSAQGSVSLGAGILWDDGGDDTYTVTGPATGYATVNGLGLGGNTGWSTYSAQGIAFSGWGIVLEEGGADAFLIRTRPGPGAEHRRAKSEHGEGAAVGLGNGNGGQGVGYSGFSIPTVGAIVAGRGPTEYVIDMGARFQASAQGQGQGPEGYLVDDGGDDVYRLEAHTAATFVRDCADCGAAELRLGGPFQQPRVAGQGQDAGTLLDREGHDRYLAWSDGRLWAEARSPAVASAMIATGWVAATAQGAGGGDLLDLGGNDAYLVHAAAASTARAAGGERSEATVRHAAFVVDGQGVAGNLEDRGGADTYEVRVDRRFRAEPDAPGAVDEGWFSVSGHGLGWVSFWEPTGPSGGLLDVDAGELDRFSIDSPLVFELCSGRYGDAPGWAVGSRRAPQAGGPESCSGGRPKAVVTSTAPGGTDAVVDIVATTPTTVAGAAALAVTLELRRADGIPLGGAAVQLAAEGRFGEPYYGVGPFTRWFPLRGGRTVTTDDDGVAHAVLLLPDCPRGSCEELRLAARFFGIAGVVRPALDRVALPAAALPDAALPTAPEARRRS